jgi:hypothetical protein
LPLGEDAAYEFRQGGGPQRIEDPGERGLRDRRAGGDAAEIRGGDATGSMSEYNVDGGSGIEGAVIRTGRQDNEIRGEPVAADMTRLPGLVREPGGERRRDRPPARGTARVVTAVGADEEALRRRLRQWAGGLERRERGSQAWVRWRPERPDARLFGRRERIHHHPRQRLGYAAPAPRLVPVPAAPLGAAVAADEHHTCPAG